MLPAPQGGGRDAPWLPALGGGSGGLLLDEVGQLGEDLALAEPAVPAEGPDGRDLAGAGPAGDGFRVDPEELGDLGRGQQFLVVRHGIGSLRWRKVCLLPIGGADLVLNSPFGPFGPGPRSVSPAAGTKIRAGEPRLHAGGTEQAAHLGAAGTATDTDGAPPGRPPAGAAPAPPVPLLGNVRRRPPTGAGSASGRRPICSSTASAGPTGPAPALGRLIHILWFMTVGKRRFVPTGPDPKRIRKQK